MALELGLYLEKIVHALDGLEVPQDLARQKEINNIRTQIKTYQIGLQRVATQQMVQCILGGLEELGPRIENLVQTAPITIRPAASAKLEQVS